MHPHRIYDCIDTLRRYYPDADANLVHKAYVFAGKVHKGDMRLSGEPYLVHPIEVAVILANLKMDATTVATGLLHDVLEDTETTVEQLAELFGPEIARIVNGLTKISKIHFVSREEYQAENLRRMLLAMADDIRILIVKLADRLHNVRTLHYADEEQQKRVAQETLDIYAPLANRLGLGVLRTELEDLAFRYLDPDIYQQLVDRINETRPEHQRTLEMVKHDLEARLTELNIEITITGRQKHLYSIYRKMQNQGISFKDVMDMIGIRVITNSKADCYSTLGIIHSIWTHIPNTFDDYINLPKPNMYQSLHTTVIGPTGKPIEIQIRTWEMHHLAEEGIASHWRYKEGKPQDDIYDKKFYELRHILEWQQDSKDPSEFIEYLKLDLFPDEVYVFTPKGDVKCLPRGATPVDFAYAVHTEVGNQCAGAKINDRIVPLRTKLNNGDIVEIITQKTHQPARDWLSFVVTSRAKAKIKHFFRVKQREEEIRLGIEMLERAIRKVGGKLSTLQADGTIKKVMAELDIANEEDFFVTIGAHKYSPKQILEKLYPDLQQPLKPKDDESKILKFLKAKLTKSGDAIKVKGVENVLTRFGHCCRPLPGDKIVGYITRGRGITIHAATCPSIMTLDLDSERMIEVEWETDPEVYYPAALYITGKPRQTLFADIIAAITKTDADILNSSSETLPTQLEVRCVVNVLGRRHLNKVIRAVRKIKSVVDVRQGEGIG